MNLAAQLRQIDKAGTRFTSDDIDAMCVLTNAAADEIERLDGIRTLMAESLTHAQTEIDRLTKENAKLREGARPGAASPGDAQRFADAACGTDVPVGFGQHVDGTDGLRSGTNIATLAEWRDFFVALFERLAPGWTPPMKWACSHKTTHAEQSVPCPVCHAWATDAKRGDV